ncbi:MAG: C40 family peptidase [Clostridia bacterium]|nr:C40 family peptidase [Clostridia bacterium]
MGNLKHAMAAIAAVSLVGSLAAVQALEFSAVRATKLTQEIETFDAPPAVLTGDGEGETADFSISAPALQIYVGNDGYILTSGGSINLRAAADTESTILDVLEVGTQVKIIDIDEDWFKIEKGEYTGYVKSEFVTLDYNKVQSVLLDSVMYREGKAVQSINVRGTADENSLILAQIGEGEEVVVLESTDNGWHKVYFGENYDIGYVSAQYITIGDMVKRTDIAAKRNSRLAAVAKNAKITTTEAAVPVKVLPSDESETITTLANKVNCKVISGGTNWTKIIVSATNEIGYVKTANVSVITQTKTANKSANSAKSAKSAKSAGTQQAAPATGSGSKLLNEASKYIGTRYVYGGTSPSGFDCSGLVQYSLRKLGVSIGRSASSQYSSGVSVSRSNLQPGDLVFFSRGGGISHVAIYAGNGQVLHAPRAGKTVRYQSLSSLTGSLKYVGAKRVM